jgi:hypothetical protein
VRVNAGPPAIALAGESEFTVGAALLIAKLKEGEVPPPGAGVLTAIAAVLAFAMSVAVIAACNWVELTKVVLLGAPFQRTDELLTNPAPLTVRAKAGPAVIALPGEIEVIVGVGF